MLFAGHPGLFSLRRVDLRIVPDQGVRRRRPAAPRRADHGVTHLLRASARDTKTSRQCAPLSAQPCLRTVSRSLAASTWSACHLPVTRKQRASCHPDRGMSGERSRPPCGRVGRAEPPSMRQSRASGAALHAAESGERSRPPCGRVGRAEPPSMRQSRASGAALHAAESGERSRPPCGRVGRAEPPSMRQSRASVFGGARSARLGQRGRARLTWQPTFGGRVGDRATVCSVGCAGCWQQAQVQPPLGFTAGRSHRVPGLPACSGGRAFRKARDDRE